MENTYQDIDCSHEAVPLRTLELLLHREPREQNTTRAPPEKISRMQTANRQRKQIRKRISEEINPARAVSDIEFTNNFGSYSENVRHNNFKCNPQKWSRALDIFRKGQGVGQHNF